MLPSELEAVNARQAELARITAELQAEEYERAREWVASRGEGLGVTPGVTAVTPLVDRSGPEPSLIIFDEAPEDICDYVPPYDGNVADIPVSEFDVDRYVDAMHDSYADPEVNPKQLQATRDQKVPLHLLEPVANAEIAKALAHGAHKYGRRNFYQTPILATVYVGALRRHTDAILDGELVDPDSGLSHWAHIGANVHVALAAMKAGTFVDDTAPEEQSEVQKRLSDASNRHGNTGGV